VDDDILTLSPSYPNLLIKLSILRGDPERQTHGSLGTILGTGSIQKNGRKDSPQRARRL